jgi:hypothetical protein
MHDTSIPNTTPIASNDVLGKELVWTPEQERFARQLGRWMQLDLPGACMFGTQRCGKTSAARAITAQAESYFGRPIFVTFLRMQKGLADREASLTAEWLQQEGALSNENAPARLRKRLRAHLVEQVKLRETDAILIFIDEAQFLTRSHLQQLIYWGDLLQSDGLRVFMMLIGQPELRTSVDSYIAMQELQIVGRFFERYYEFLGIEPSEIELVMQAHETEVIALDGSSSPPAVAALFPEAWEAGWRPSKWAPVVVDGIAQVAARAGLPRDQRIPMQHLRSTLLGLLLYAMALRDPDAKISTDEVVKALTDTGIHETWSKYAALARK